jgi:hypothetical protein
MGRSERAIDAVAAWLEARLAWRPDDDFVWQARHRGGTLPMSANSCRLASFGALYSARSPDGVLDSGGTANRALASLMTACARWSAGINDSVFID